MAEKEKDETTSSNGEEVEAEAAPWGTLEELLLACAVNRHGTTSWDAVADELQKHTKKPFTSHHCKNKYSDLKRRFTGAVAGEEVSGEVDERGDDDGELLRMVEELRKLRVEELKREVQRHDVSIVSLQMKVKRLEEERERSISKAEGEEPEASDLRIESNGNATGRTGYNADGEPARSSPEKVISGESADGRSFNESNSTNHNKAEEKATTPDGDEEEREPKSRREPDEKGENRSESQELVPVRSTEPGKEGGSGSRQGTSRPGDLGESVSESKKQPQQQQSSDVQSSASLSKKKRRRFRGLGGGGSSGDELEAEGISPANKRISENSQPLIRFLETLRSHKHGSVFQRRLPSQETEKYRNVIRQHMDLDTVQSRLDKGVYSDCHPKFYRDLLLIFTNAVMFYRKSSAEHIAARELRKLVIDEIAQRTRKPTKTIQPVKPDPEPQNLEPVVKKPRSSTNMVVCRRRSSTSMQVLSESMKKKEESNTNTNTNTNENDEKSNTKSGGKVEKSKGEPPQKKVDSGGNSSNASVSRREKDGEKSGGSEQKKVLTRERSALGRGGGGSKMSESTTSSKKMITKEAANNRERVGRCNNNNNNSSNKEESSEGEGAEPDQEVAKKKTNASVQKGTSTLKKQGVANFLKRMEQNSPSSQEKASKKKEPEEEEQEEEEKEVGKKEKVESTKKRGGNPKRGSREVETPVAASRSSGRRGGGGERETPVMTRRSGNGRPPKRKVAMMSSTPESGKGGRSGGGRDGGDKSKKKARR